MTLWLLTVAVVLAGLFGLAVGGLSVQRFSPGHVVAQLAIAGCGVYFSRTADGTWWRLRLRPCGRCCEDRSDWGEPPAENGVREPRRPLGPGPSAAAAAVDRCSRS